MQIERCDECRFDGSRWDARDTLTTLPSLAARFGYSLEGLSPELLGTRPDPTTWSPVEYVDHVRETLFGARLAVAVGRDEPGRDLGASPAPRFDAAPRELDAAIALAAVDAAAAALFRLGRDLTPEQWDDAGVVVDGELKSAGWWLRHAVHDASHHLHDVGRIRVRLGAGAPSGRGVVEQISRSGGGVPKHAVERAAVGWRGIEGDEQRDRKNHGRPWQALCLWSAEVIEDLRAEGHPISPGAAGENLTVSGLDWATLRPGTILRVGAAVCEISSYALPCTKNGQWFADGNHRRIEHERHPGWSRVYASVLEPGAVATGDPVEVEPVLA